MANVGRHYDLKDLKDDAVGGGGSRLRKGEVFAYVGRNQNLKDLKAGGAAFSNDWRALKTDQAV